MNTIIQHVSHSLSQLMTVERIHLKAPVMLIFIAIFTCLPSCINLSNISQLSIIRLKEVKVLSIKPIFICKQLTHGHFCLHG